MKEVDMTGRVHIDKLELRGEGEDFQEVKELSQRHLKAGIGARGDRKMANTLAKIFSILNVSQRFWEGSRT